MPYHFKSFLVQKQDKPQESTRIDRPSSAKAIHLQTHFPRKHHKRSTGRSRLRSLDPISSILHHIASHLRQNIAECKHNTTRANVQRIIDKYRCDADGAHIQLPTGYNKMSGYVRIRVFDGINVSHRVLKEHCDDLCYILDIKCGNRIDVQQRFIDQFLASYPIFVPQNKPTKLSDTQSMEFFINSRQGLTRWCGENSKLHRIVAVRIFSSERV
eukprot:265175_1